ncbi:hypothetical protein KA005_18175 [bacterium]|nr:hypothetical protein [bacterium]
MEILIIIAALAIAILPNIKKWDPINALLNYMGLDRSKIANGIKPELWNALQPDNVDTGGKWIGLIERFLSVVAAWTGGYEILIAWFAFKVASKWQTWSSLVKIPDQLDEISDIDFLKARRILSARLYDRLLIGSGVNVGLGIVVGLLGKYFFKLFS